VQPYPGGPPSVALVRGLAREAWAGVAAAGGDVDGVFCPLHGGMCAAGTGGGANSDDDDDSEAAWIDDPDGCFLAGLRSALDAMDGSTGGGRIVATLDLHCNISARMLAAADVLVPHRTNPHVDDTQRGEEAAVILLELLASSSPTFTAAARLPLVTPAVRQLTAEGQPYGGGCTR
jgi:microcystin degradation protein MlrC